MLSRNSKEQLKQSHGVWDEFQRNFSSEQKKNSENEIVNNWIGMMIGDHLYAKKTI